MKLIVTNLEHFASCIESKLESLEWQGKRDIIRVLVKRIEISHDKINIIFRVSDMPNSDETTKISQHCRNSVVCKPDPQVFLFMT